MLKLPAKLQNLPSVRDVVYALKLKPDKKLGQNFLFDSGITDQIVIASGDLEGRTVLEIGPGPGALTRSLLASKAKKVVAVEADQRCLKALEQLRDLSDGRLEILMQDAMRLDYSKLASDKLFVIANLPYNIGTTLLFDWLDQVHYFSGFMLMLQKEVVDRICAKPSTNHYGKLSILAQIKADVENVFDVDPEYFYPPPKVTSSIVRVMPFSSPKFKYDEVRLKSILIAAFGKRRKMIRTSLSGTFPNLEEISKSLDLDLNMRAEDLTPEQYCQLSML
jgi:16S rRNA (adenine1518-N6/adenine1519-N6)-dimethyltransferase